MSSGLLESAARVIPAQAGIHANPFANGRTWAPACAGVTAEYAARTGLCSGFALRAIS